MRCKLSSENRVSVLPSRRESIEMSLPGCMSGSSHCIVAVTFSVDQEFFIGKCMKHRGCTIGFLEGFAFACVLADSDIFAQDAKANVLRQPS